MAKPKTLKNLVESLPPELEAGRYSLLRLLIQQMRQENKTFTITCRCGGEARAVWPAWNVQAIAGVERGASPDYAKVVETYFDPQGEPPLIITCPTCRRVSIEPAETAELPEDVYKRFSELVSAWRKRREWEDALVPLPERFQHIPAWVLAEIVRQAKPALGLCEQCTKPIRPYRVDASGFSIRITYPRRFCLECKPNAEWTDVSEVGLFHYMQSQRFRFAPEDIRRMEAGLAQLIKGQLAQSQSM